MDFEYFKAIVAEINKLYGTTSDIEHQFIHEFFEGQTPLFKLILSELDGAQLGTMIVSFHIDLDTVDAIQWFLRVRNLDPNLHLTGVYLKDEAGVSYVGEDAVILRMQQVEHELAANWKRNGEELETENADVPPLPVQISPTRSFMSYKDALIEFKNMKKKKGDNSH